MREFGYQRAHDVSGALALLAADPRARFLGGGTNLVDLMKSGVERPARLVDVRELPLDHIETTEDGGLRIGATVTNAVRHATGVRHRHLPIRVLLGGGQVFDVAGELSRWIQEARTFAVATVVAVNGDGPRVPGAVLAVDVEGTAIGSVSGGCEEEAVRELCGKALADGDPVIERFRYCGEEASSVGLTGGGFIDVLVAPVLAGTPVGGVFRSAVIAAAHGEPAALARVVRGPADKIGAALVVRPDGSYEGGFGGSAELDLAAAAAARDLLEAGRGGRLDLRADGLLGPGGLTLFVEPNMPPP
ncbi:XdhC family protein [Streptomyces sp. T028]|uniref:XdhC family protein n=1 Tax=Streptomyces sp. T028 TaxID=3394379 RepID=UPI003A88B557